MNLVADGFFWSSFYQRTLLDADPEPALLSSTQNILLTYLPTITYILGHLESGHTS